MTVRYRYDWTSIQSDEWQATLEKQGWKKLPCPTEDDPACAGIAQANTITNFATGVIADGLDLAGRVFYEPWYRPIGYTAAAAAAGITPSPCPPPGWKLVQLTPEELAGTETPPPGTPPPGTAEPPPGTTPPGTAEPPPGTTPPPPTVPPAQTEGAPPPVPPVIPSFTKPYQAKLEAKTSAAGKVTYATVTTPPATATEAIQRAPFKFSMLPRQTTIQIAGQQPLVDWNLVPVDSPWYAKTFPSAAAIANANTYRALLTMAGYTPTGQVALTATEPDKNQIDPKLQWWPTNWNNTAPGTATVIGYQLLRAPF